MPKMWLSLSSSWFCQAHVVPIQSHNVTSKEKASSLNLGEWGFSISFFKMMSSNFLQKYQAEINLEILSTVRHSKRRIRKKKQAENKQKEHFEVLNKIKQVCFLKTLFWNNFRQRKTGKTALTVHIYS